MRSQLLFNALQEHPIALRHASPTNTQKNLLRIFATFFVRSFFSYLFLQQFILRIFLTIYFGFDYIFFYIYLK